MRQQLAKPAFTQQAERHGVTGYGRILLKLRGTSIKECLQVAIQAQPVGTGYYGFARQCLEGDGQTNGQVMLTDHGQPPGAPTVRMSSVRSQSCPSLS